MNDVMKVARDRREELIGSIADLNKQIETMTSEIDRLDTFLRIGEGLIEGGSAPEIEEDGGEQAMTLEEMRAAVKSKTIRDESDLELSRPENDDEIELDDFEELEDDADDLETSRVIRQIMPLKTESNSGNDFGFPEEN